jgi:hypothetical protein
MKRALQIFFFLGKYNTKKKKKNKKQEDTGELRDRSLLKRECISMA